MAKKSCDYIGISGRCLKLVMEQKLGRPVKPGEVVSYINGDPADERPENLWLFSSWGELVKARVDEQARKLGPLPANHLLLKKHLRCSRYLEQNLTCEFPYLWCKSCAYHKVKHRPKRGGLWDRSDPAQCRAYYRDYRRKKRAEEKAAG